jgi:hypothetical protein
MMVLVSLGGQAKALDAVPQYVMAMLSSAARVLDPLLLSARTTPMLLVRTMVS